MLMTSDQPIDRKSTIGCTVTTYSSQFAPKIFKTVSNRLLDVNTWHRLSDSILPAFKVVDDDGSPLSRPVQQSDRIRIEPMSNESGINDFLRIESVQYESDPARESEALTIGVSRIPDPDFKVLESRLPESDVVATFRVLRKGLNITAELLDEVSSEDETKKNPMLGVYRIQWRSFVNGILTDLKV